MDDGEGLKMNYTFGLPNGAKEMDVDRDSIFLGAKVVQIKVKELQPELIKAALENTKNAAAISSESQAKAAAAHLN